jgi:hypothetical protein
MRRRTFPALGPLPRVAPDAVHPIDAANDPALMDHVVIVLAAVTVVPDDAAQEQGPRRRHETPASLRIAARAARPASVNVYLPARAIDQTAHEHPLHLPGDPQPHDLDLLAAVDVLATNCNVLLTISPLAPIAFGCSYLQSFHALGLLCTAQ